MNVPYQNKNGEVLIVTLRRKPNRFELDAWLGLLYYFMQFHCIYTLKCAFQSAGRFIAVRLTTPILFWISLSKASTNTVHSTSDERRYFIASRIWYKPLCTCCAIVNICFGYWYIKHTINKKVPPGCTWKIRGVVGSVIIIIQLLLRLSRSLFQKRIQAPTISCST